MRNFSRFMGGISTGAIAVACMAVAKPVAAQEAEAGEQRQSGVDEIIVTARKRAEPLQETPVAVTAIGGEALDRIYATDLGDLSGRAPNVLINTIGNFSSSVSVFIRGIGNGDPDSSLDPSVGIYIDGVYLPRTANSALDMFDVEQVEILRGPQGTLFGRNTTGGAINYRTKRPTGEFDIRGSITLGEFGQRDIRAAVETPIVEDVLAFKIAALSQHLDGYYTNTNTSGGPGFRSPQDAGSADTFTVRPALLFTPTDSFELTIIGEYMRERSQNLPSINVSTPGQLLQVVYGPETFGRDEEVRDFAWNVPGFSNIDVWGITAEANLELGEGTLTSITNYRETDDINNNDTDGTVAPFFETLRDQPHDQFSTELRYNWVPNDRVNVVAGLYYFRQKYFLRRDTFLNFAN
ncbi:MAG: TonB-dependent receptor, partial [Sphingomonadales bacterium]